VLVKNSRCQTGSVGPSSSGDAVLDTNDRRLRHAASLARRRQVPDQ
jgi:hypothetical protein